MGSCTDPIGKTLVERLRDAYACGAQSRLCEEAADEIERLRAEIERLHGVVRHVNSRCDHLGMRLGEVIRERDALLATVSGASAPVLPSAGEQTAAVAEAPTRRKRLWGRP